MRYLITFSYDGSCFNGYQRQNKLKTIQGEIEKVLTDVNDGKKVEIHSSGRTDKGVHALNQKAHFDLDVNIKLYGLKKILNKKLNGEIYIKDVCVVDNDFHARYFVKKKIYSYYINTLEFDPIRKDYCYQYCDKLNISKMKKTSKYLIGEHDFRSFCKEEKDKENCVRKIYKVNITNDNGIIKITLVGNGFLRKMVRNIVGELIEVGKGKKDINHIKELINSKGELHNKKSVPACGLYLEDVMY